MGGEFMKNRTIDPEDILLKMKVTNVDQKVDNEGTTSIDFAWLYLTLRCNSNCVWCYTKLDSFEEPSDIPLTLAKNIITLLSDLNVKEINLIGGEPTLYPDLFDLIQFIKSKKIRVSISTNGWALSNMDFAKKLKELIVDELAISIEGSNPEIHDSITAMKGSFDKTIKGIKNCLQLNLNFKVNIVVSQSNKNNLLNLLNYLADIGVKNMDFDLCISPFFEKCDEVMSPREYAKIFPILYLEAIKRNINVGFDRLGPLCLYDPESYKKMKESKVYRAKLCDIIKGNKIVIDCKGNILPCNQFCNLPIETLVADKETNRVISKDEFSQKWKSNRLVDFRAKISRLPSYKCKKCEIVQECFGGGCPLLWLTFDPETEIRFQ